MGGFHHLHPLLLLLLPLLISSLTTKEKKLIVEKHNFYRSKSDPPAANMRTLSWDSTLEELATSYAAKCIWDHNVERGFRGENLFLMSGSGLDVDMGLADWHNERDFYNFTADTCQEGQMCGHYTQMVWANTERVGCGENFCEKIEGFEDGNMYLLVCNYEPPGNFQGQKPFTVGAPCSACPETHTCKESLCEDRSYMGNHVSSPGLGQAHRSACPYPCLQQPATFPLYQTNIVTPWGGQLHKDWSSFKVMAKKPCKLFGYKRGVYSLYLPSQTMEENLTPPKS